MPSAKTVGEWIVEFMNSYERHDFRKAGDHVIVGERSLLKILKFFFLAKYPRVRPEIPAHGNGRIDFGFNDLGVEVVVKNKSGIGNLIVGQNGSEMRKLRKHDGRSALALINMEKNSNLSLDHLIEDYRRHSLGKGNHSNAKSITVLAIGRGDDEYDMRRYVVRARA